MTAFLVLALTVQVFTADTIDKSSATSVRLITNWLREQSVKVLTTPSDLSIEVVRPKAEQNFGISARYRATARKSRRRPATCPSI